MSCCFSVSYGVDDSARADAVEKLLAGESVIGVQALNELAAVLRQKRAMGVADVRTLSNTVISSCEVHDLSVRAHQTALALMARYDLSFVVRPTRHHGVPRNR